MENMLLVCVFCSHCISTRLQWSKDFPGAFPLWAGNNWIRPAYRNELQWLELWTAQPLDLAAFSSLYPYISLLPLASLSTKYANERKHRWNAFSSPVRIFFSFSSSIRYFRCFFFFSFSSAATLCPTKVRTFSKTMRRFFCYTH